MPQRFSLVEASWGLKRFDIPKNCVYNRGVVWAKKKRPPGGGPVLHDSANYHCFPNAQSIPKDAKELGTGMDAINFHRRFSLRRAVYLSTHPQPAKPLQLVFTHGRGPPSPQTHYGEIAFSRAN